MEMTPCVELERPVRKVLYGLQPKQFQAWKLTPLYRKRSEPYPENIGYGGAAGGGKSYLSRAVITGAALMWPGSTSIIFRKTEREVAENHVEKIRQEVPDVIDGERIYTWDGEKMLMRWANGSKTYFGYLRLDEDVFRYQGPEYDVMVFEEATHYTWKMVSWLTGNRLRGTTSLSRPFCLYPSNPGSRGHSWYKRLFIEKLYHEEDDEQPDNYAFVQAFLTDNEVLRSRDPRYEKRLNRLPEPWRSWQRDGDWHSGAGGAFPELYSKVHLIKPFVPPPHWRRWGAFDWGFAHPFSFGDYVVDEEGSVIKVETVTGLRMQPHDQARAIKRKVPIEKLQYIVAGHDLWSKRGRAYGEEGRRLYDIFMEHGLVFIHADIDRQAGYANMLDYLAWKTRGVEDPVTGEVRPGEPRFRLMDTPGNRWAFRQFENLVLDPTNLEDVLKMDADERGDSGDDAYDETRYALQSVHGPSEGVLRHTAVSGFRPEVLAYETARSKIVRDIPDDDGTTGLWHPDLGSLD